MILHTHVERIHTHSIHVQIIHIQRIMYILTECTGSNCSGPQEVYTVVDSPIGEWRTNGLEYLKRDSLLKHQEERRGQSTSFHSVRVNYLAIVRRQQLTVSPRIESDRPEILLSTLHSTAPPPRHRPCPLTHNFKPGPRAIFAMFRIVHHQPWIQLIRIPWKRRIGVPWRGVGRRGSGSGESRGISRDRAVRES